MNINNKNQNSNNKIYLITIIISLDSIEKSKKKLLQDCIYLRGVVKDSNTRSLVILILIINSCDRVEKKANELLEACIYVAGETKDATAQDMVNFIKYLIPKFSCAGFFGINQMVLSTFLSTTSTYIIIILQFRAINPPT
uniref:Uncharacterized protein LOC114328342 isoform X1 n=1 Tax=Diabrotica virgifera virgifera TaxID=50390 RepID=A0A6P7FAR5_DIAVI